MTRGVAERVRAVPADSPQQWNELVAANSGCFFQRHEWLATMAELLGLRFHAYLLLADDEPVGVAPMLVKPLGPLCTVNWLPFPYVGPVAPAELLPLVWPVLRRIERRARAVRSQQVLQSTVAAGETGYVGHPDRTFVLRLADRSEDELLAGVEAKRRAKLRRASRAGVRVRPATETEITRLLPAWTDATFAAQQLPPPYPAAGYAAVWQRFGTAPEARFSTAVLADRPVCVQATFAGAPRAVAWAMASAPDPASSLALPLLYWDTVCWARTAGCAELDFVGAPTEGVARYKRDWGATELAYSVLRRQSGLHAVAMRAAQVVRVRAQASAGKPAG